jgi:hypothetical protein
MDILALGRKVAKGTPFKVSEHNQGARLKFHGRSLKLIPQSNTIVWLTVEGMNTSSWKHPELMHLDDKDGNPHAILVVGTLSNRQWKSHLRKAAIAWFYKLIQAERLSAMAVVRETNEKLAQLRRGYL